ncbi:hypothetical protein [Parapedobacter lycopersici]|uniref:hypothetical protein n=1 Tax=Parapedobacter lycopersici TaxID=1864939 RepID=UPI00214D181E|nr:hypothetical protein [Parapedobacter lycopersici]
MKKIFKSRMRFVVIPILAIAFLFLVSYLVMVLWNYTLPGLLGVSTITLWQSTALFFLCKILFGFGKGGPKRGGPPWAGKYRGAGFRDLSETEREKMKARMRARWCGWEDADPVRDREEDTQNHEK